MGFSVQHGTYVQAGGLGYVVGNVADEGTGGVYQEAHCGVLDTSTLQSRSVAPRGRLSPYELCRISLSSLS
jgi:hypothetical protein